MLSPFFYAEFAPVSEPRDPDPPAAAGTADRAPLGGGRGARRGPLHRSSRALDALLLRLRGPDPQPGGVPRRPPADRGGARRPARRGRPARGSPPPGGAERRAPGDGEPDHRPGRPELVPRLGGEHGAAAGDDPDRPGQ